MELNLPWHLRHVAGDIAEETPLRVWRNEAEQVGLKRGGGTTPDACSKSRMVTAGVDCRHSAQSADLFAPRPSFWTLDTPKRLKYSVNAQPHVYLHGIIESFREYLESARISSNKLEDTGLMERQIGGSLRNI